MRRLLVFTFTLAIAYTSGLAREYWGGWDDGLSGRIISNGYVLGARIVSSTSYQKYESLDERIQNDAVQVSYNEYEDRGFQIHPKLLFGIQRPIHGSVSFAALGSLGYGYAYQIREPYPNNFNNGIWQESDRTHGVSLGLEFQPTFAVGERLLLFTKLGVASGYEYRRRSNRSFISTAGYEDFRSTRESSWRADYKAFGPFSLSSMQLGILFRVR